MIITSFLYSDHRFSSDSVTVLALIMQGKLFSYTLPEKKLKNGILIFSSDSVTVLAPIMQGKLFSYTLPGKKFGERLF